MANTTPEKQVVLISGLPGKVATLVAQGVSKTPDLELYNRALSSERGREEFPILVFGGKEITLVSPVDNLDVVSPVDNLAVLRKLPSGSIAVDFTRPDTANRNAELFAHFGVPFVMGTTGGDREKLLDTVRQSKISADRKTEIEFYTRIDGRSVYVVGTLQAIRFLAEKVRSGSQGEVFSMIDVLTKK